MNEILSVCAVVWHLMWGIVLPIVLLLSIVFMWVSEYYALLNAAAFKRAGDWLFAQLTARAEYLKEIRAQKVRVKASVAITRKHLKDELASDPYLKQVERQLKETTGRQSANAAGAAKEGA